jgi:hypothetical protein
MPIAKRVDKVLNLVKFGSVAGKTGLLEFVPSLRQLAPTS